MKNVCCFLIIVWFGCVFGYSQDGFKLQNNKNFDKIRFQLINNLIVLPVVINDVELSFILDTGVAKPIVFSFLGEADTLKFNNAEAFLLKGLGEGQTYEALRSKNNVFKIGDAVSLNQELYAIHDASLNFSPQLGVPIHGIIGFDLFKAFIIEINYTSKYIKLFNPEYYEYRECDNCEVVNLEFYNNKPYLNASLKLHDQTIPVKLLIDSGGSDSLWVFEDRDLGLYEDDRFFIDFLGSGLSGSVYGKRGKVQEFNLKSFRLHDVNVAYPDSSAIIIAKQFKTRNGSVSGNILKRFNMIVDYRKAQITLKKNKLFKEDFSYNNSGIELEQHGTILVKDKGDYRTDNVLKKNIDIEELGLTPSYDFDLKPAFVVVELRDGSPAQRAGVLKGDVVISVNNRDAYNYKLQEIVHLFYGREGEHIILKVDRNGFLLTYTFNLESPLK